MSHPGLIDAAELLCGAYAKGDATGSVDWSDVDNAYQVAKATLKEVEKKRTRPVSNGDMGSAYLHCSLCLQEKPPGQSPVEWARQQGAWTEVGLQIWCTRHDVNIMHVDFEGSRHSANSTRRLMPGEGEE